MSHRLRGITRRYCRRKFFRGDEIVRASIGRYEFQLLCILLYLTLSVFFMLVILVDVYWYLVVILICIFLMSHNVFFTFFKKPHKNPTVLSVGVMTYCFVIVCFLFCGLEFYFKLFCFFIKCIFNLKNLHLLVLINSKVYPTTTLL